uniref:Uncharacterized protein n=1 Tax=Geladintestivirus 1 TaxID=3233133 RepID=A0AAU8MJB0_9CAUD
MVYTFIYIIFALKLLLIDESVVMRLVLDLNLFLYIKDMFK